MQCEADGVQTTLATSGTALSLTVGNWYTLKAVIDDDPLNSALQRLRFWVDSDDDGDWSDETALITSTAIDDDWPAGYAGVHRGVQTAAAEQFDSFKVGYDNNADADIDDAGDDVQVDDNFDSAAISLSYDNNGNLTEDGVFKYVYDAWNRLVIVKRVPDAATTIATYAYDGLSRRVSKVVTNQGDEVVANDCGNTTVHFFYCGYSAASSLRRSVAPSLRRFFPGASAKPAMAAIRLRGSGFGARAISTKWSSWT